MIKAIIFDCFGVLTSDGWLPFKQKFFGSDARKFEEAGRINFLADSGKITNDQFINQVSQLAGVSSEEFIKASESNVANKPIFDFIKSLKEQDYKIGMLSNVSGDWLARLFSKEQVELFDALSLSYDSGFAKPDRKAYEIICQKLDCIPQEAVFIDDQERFVKGAVQSGMKAILYKDLENLKSELSKILEMSNTDK